MNTRRAADESFHQERYCSSPELEGDAINALVAAKRIAVVESAETRALLWWIQWRSLAPAGIQQLCEELRAAFPHRFGTTAALQKFYAVKRSGVSKDELRQIEKESHHVSARHRLAMLCSVDDFLDDEDGYRRVERASREEQMPTPREEVDEYREAAADKASSSLSQFLRECCVDPGTNVEAGCWYFIDLPDALRELRARQIAAAKARIADTLVSRQINDALDFWKARRRMILIEGVAGIGRTATLRAWCDAQAGLVRYVEVPSSTDDRSFYVSIARELGVARGMSFSGQQIKVRVEETLRASGLMLALDESQYLWGNALRPRKTPDRILWIKTAFDAGTPIALVAHTDFTKWQQHFVERTLWTDEQFERRINRTLRTPIAHGREDLLKIARVHFPTGDERSWKLLAAYALGTPKKRASAIVEAMESACYRAELQGRSAPVFADIEAALREEHAFLQTPPAVASESTAHEACNGIADPLQSPRNARDRASSTSLFPTDRRKPDRRSAALNPAILAD